MSFVKSEDNLKIYYKRIKGKKNKPTLFFIHGWLMNRSYFKDIIKYLKLEGYSIIYQDIRGHGKSEVPKTSKQFSIEHMSKDINSILQKEKIDKIILIGHSMGGMVSSYYACKNNSKLSKLILLNTTYANPIKTGKIPYLNKRLSKAQKLYNFVLNKSNKKDSVESINFNQMKTAHDINIAFKGVRNHSVHNSVEFIKAMANYDVSKKLSKIKVPTYIISANKDQFFSIKLTTEFAKKIKNSKYKILDGTHNIPLKKPILIASEIENFITSK